MPSRKRRQELHEKRAAERRLWVPIAEQLLMDHLPHLSEFKHGRILATTVGRGQFISAATRAIEPVSAVCHFLDSYKTREAATVFSEEQLPIQSVCTSDLPSETLDLAAFPIDPRGEAELTRDLLQQAHARLRTGGKLIASTSNPDDQWLHNEVRTLFGKATRQPSRKGVFYSAVRTEAEAKYKEFDSEFAFRDRDVLLKLFSRPGVFSHRTLDTGARALINVLELAPGERFVDLGCGSGAVAVAAAARSPDISVLALDSNPRAVESTRRSAELNHLSSITVHLDDQGAMGESATYDVVAGNPPYYSNYQIAELFLRVARRLLKPGGRVLMVTKTPEWFVESMSKYFVNITERNERGYVVVCGEKRRE